MDDINLYLQNNDNLLPRDQVTITEIVATPYPDGRRVNVAVAITPFRERPNLEITIVRAADGESSQPDSETPAPRKVASTSVIAIMTFRVDFNLHLRGIEDTAGNYRVQVALYYGDDARSPQHTHSVDLTIPEQE